MTRRPGWELEEVSEALDTWLIVEDAFDVANNRHFEGLMAIGSGPLQQRASLEEGLTDDPQDRAYVRLMSGAGEEPPPAFKSRLGTYMPGVTGPHPTCGDELINLPALHGLVLYAGNERLDMQRCRIEGYRRQLDLRTGRLSREFIWHTERGSAVGVRFERFISAQRRHVMALRCHLRHVSGPAAELRFNGTLDADVRTNGFDHFQRLAFTGEHAPITVEARTNGGDLVAAAALMTCEPGVVLNIETEPRWAATGGMTMLDPGAELTICTYAAMTSSRHVQGSPLDAARNLAWDAAGVGFARLAAESDEVWRQRWEQTDVVIEGDPAAQLGLRISLYHLLRGVVEHDRRVGLDPTATSGEAHCGRYTWETEICVLPMLLYTRPEVGRRLAAFRIASLDGARRNARGAGYAGARYALESAPNGEECSPNWQQAAHAVHVTADVAYGLWHAHLANPEDVPFLARVTEVLTETARYWSQRVTFNAERDEYEVLMATGPDEYAPLCRNNAYTNYLAATVLSLTGSAWEALAAADEEQVQALRAELSVSEDELARFADVAGRVRLPYNADRRLVLAAEDFFAQEPFDFDKWWPNRGRPLAASVARERLARSRVLQRSDVLLLMALFPHQFDDEQMRAAYETYVPLTAHDASVSKSVCAQVAAWLGREEEAVRLWRESVALDMAPPNAAEGVHAAAAGHNWQAVVLGFAGVRTRIQSEVLWIEPHLPADWSALRFPLVWRGQALRVGVERRGVTIEHRGGAPVAARILGRDCEVKPGETQTFTA